ncbi:hypothetical protein IWW45_006148, partial [Coemansia sp. RSA 485]
LPPSPSGSSRVSVDGAEVLVAEEEADAVGNENSVHSEISLEKDACSEEEWVTDL